MKVNHHFFKEILQKQKPRHTAKPSCQGGWEMKSLLWMAVCPAKMQASITKEVENGYWVMPNSLCHRMSRPDI